MGRAVEIPPPSGRRVADERLITNRAKQLSRRLRLLHSFGGVPLPPVQPRLEAAALLEPRERFAALIEIHDEIAPLVRAALGDGAKWMLATNLVDAWRAES